VVVGVGAFKPEMAEIGATTLAGSALYADDPAGARHEAGDLLRAGIDWGRVQSLATLLREGPERGRPAVFKSVGTGAWDLAAARVAVQALGLAA
jgi:1-piperideine-2-carboxylate/1-pyrroline-2-carboxylate reductase [NAD(P)H]